MFFKKSKKNEIIVQVSVYVEQDGDVFYAYSPTMPGLHVEGNSEAEVKKYVEDAVVAYLSSLIKHNDPLPVGTIVREVPTAQMYTFTGHLPAYA